MLKDNILKNFQIKKDNPKNNVIDRIQNKIKGRLEVFGYEKGKMFHYDDGENIVTDWAKHLLTNMITGDSFNYINQANISQFLFAGKIFPKRILNTFGQDGSYANGVMSSHSASTNYDGSLISGEQYFSPDGVVDGNLAELWNYHRTVSSKVTFDSSGNITAVSDLGYYDKMFPNFPTKMLFGTGKEFRYVNGTAASTSELIIPSAEYQTYIIDELGIPEAEFYNTAPGSGKSIDNDWNNYGGYYEQGIGLVPSITVNDISGAQLDSITDQTTFSVKGAIKNGSYWNSEIPVDQDKIEPDGQGGYILKPEYRGKGQPAFIYMKRTATKYDTASEVYISNDYVTSSNPADLTGLSIETPKNGATKMTFTVVMPEQTGVNAGKFYPYNNYNLKSAGIFSDSPYLTGNTNNLDLGNLTTEQNQMLQRMPYGTLFATRNIAPIYKSSSRTISFKWTISVSYTHLTLPTKRIV